MWKALSFVVLWFGGLGDCFVSYRATNKLHVPRSRMIFSSISSNEALAEEVQKLKAEVLQLEMQLGIDLETRVQADLQAQRRKDAIAAAQARKDRIRAGAELVATQMRSVNATTVELVLFNDPVNKRERVQNILQGVAGLSDEESEKTMMNAHKGGKGVVGVFNDDPGALEGAEVLRLKLAEAKLLVALVPVKPETKSFDWPWISSQGKGLFDE